MTTGASKRFVRLVKPIAVGAALAKVIVKSALSQTVSTFDVTGASKSLTAVAPPGRAL